MANIITLTSLDAPELDVYARLTQAQLRNRLEPEKGLFIAESPKVIGTALDTGLEPVSFLMEQRHITGDAAPLLARFPDVPVYTAERELHLSANYFGDLVKRLTGKTAQEHIRLRLIDAAKERIADPARSIAEVAYELGFKYPAHFTRLFKNVVGCTPNRYRNIN